MIFCTVIRGSVEIAIAFVDGIIQAAGHCAVAIITFTIKFFASAQQTFGASGKFTGKTGTFVGVTVDVFRRWSRTALER